MAYKILFLGPKENATTLQRIKALEENGNEVRIVYDRIVGEKVKLFKRAYRYLLRKLGWRAEFNNENYNLVHEAEKFTPDLVFVSKGLTIKYSTIQKIRRLCPIVKIICYSLDDIMNPGNQSKQYLKSIPYYDIHFTTKKYNVKELLDMGAKRVELTQNSYSSIVHRPVVVSELDKKKFGSDISFVGGYEKERGEILLRLAKNGIVIRIWGNNWHKFKKRHKNLIIEYKPAYGDDYGKVVCSSKIILGFLRKINRDTITTRSVEIPAFGAFLLAERTEDHLALLIENDEAAYFDDFQELLDKIKHFIKHDDQREKIAWAGHKKVVKLGLNYNNSMRELVQLSLHENQ